MLKESGVALMKYVVNYVHLHFVEEEDQAEEVDKRRR